MASGCSALGTAVNPHSTTAGRLPFPGRLAFPACVLARIGIDKPEDILGRGTMEPNCWRCRFCDPNYAECRRYPPQMTFSHLNEPRESAHGFFPSIQASDWCGEYRPLEDK